MTPKGKTKRQKEPETEIPTDSNNMDGMPLQGELLLAIRDVMKEMAQHRVEMVAQRNVDNGLQNEVTPPVAQPEASNKVAVASMIDKLAKFKKFALTPFREAKTPEEAEVWSEY